MYQYFYYSWAVVRLCFVLPLCLLFFSLSGQNHSLRFDGIDDFITTGVGNSVLAVPNTPFTYELWFLTEESYGPSYPLIDGRPLLLLNGQNTRISVTETAGGVYQLNVRVGSFINSTTIPMTTAETGEWRHLAVTYDGLYFRAYVDCGDPATITFFNNTLPQVAGFRLGFSSGDLGLRTWRGRQDEFKAWSRALSEAEICQSYNCSWPDNLNGLAIHWPFNQGVPGGNNTGIAQVTDASGNGLNGNIVNFGLTGNNGNFLLGGAPAISPNLNGLDLSIRNLPFPGEDETVTICDGDPLHFCLEINGQAITYPANLSIVWEQMIGDGDWETLPESDFSGVCFPVAPDVIAANCQAMDSANDLIKYRAIAKVENPVTGGVCEYITPVRSVLVCCPLSDATVVVSPNESALCAGDEKELSVSLQSPDAFIVAQNIGTVFTINWQRTDPSGTVNLNIDALQFTDVYTASSNAPGSVVYSATVSPINCPDKTRTFTSPGLTIDAQPVCGSIDGFPLGNPQNLVLLEPGPNPVYSICPGLDATLSIVVPGSFQDCDPVWERSFDNITWSIFGGTGNDIQNTNILPTGDWPGERIFYRILCAPLSDPSDCEFCVSNTVEIRLDERPATPIIIAETVPECVEDFPVGLSIANPQPNENYQWLFNGLPINTGTSITAIQPGCYQVIASDDCFLVESELRCLDVCQMEALILCPVVIGEPGGDARCLSEGDEAIYQSSVMVSPTCAPPYGFRWFLNGEVLMGENDAFLFLTTPGEDYVVGLEVTNPATGCTTYTELEISPC